MTKHISKIEQNFIRKELPEVSNILLRKDKETYSKMIVSVFERFMTPEEFEIYDDIDDKTLNERRRKFELSVIKMYENTTCYLWKFKRHKRIFFYKPTNLKQVLNKCDIKSQTFMTGIKYEILMPEYSAIYSCEWDWTNIIWYKNEEKIQPLLKIIKDSGLHIIG